MKRKMDIFDSKQLCCERKDIKRQTRTISEERLEFLDGKAIGEVDIFIESGETRRKVRRIIEKRVCQDFHRREKVYGSNNYGRYHEKHRVSNHMKNIYGESPAGFRYCCAA